MAELTEAYNDKCDKLDVAVTFIAYVMSQHELHIPCSEICSGFSNLVDRGIECPLAYTDDYKVCANAILSTLQDDQSLRNNLEKRVKRLSDERKGKVRIPSCTSD